MHTSRTSLTLQEGQAPPSHRAPCSAVATQQQHTPRRVHKAAPAWGAAPARRRRHPWRRRVRRAGEQAESVDVPLGARAARLHADVQCTRTVPRAARPPCMCAVATVATVATEASPRATASWMAPWWMVGGGRDVLRGGHARPQRRSCRGITEQCGGLAC